MSKWTYLHARIPATEFDARLEALGNDGWELAAAQPLIAFEYQMDGYGQRTMTAPEYSLVTDWECVFKRKARPQEQTT